MSLNQRIIRLKITDLAGFPQDRLTQWEADFVKGLLEKRGSVSDKQAKKIGHMWDNLPDNHKSSLMIDQAHDEISGLRPCKLGGPAE